MFRVAIIQGYGLFRIFICLKRLKRQLECKSTGLTGLKRTSFDQIATGLKHFIDQRIRTSSTVVVEVEQVRIIAVVKPAARIDHEKGIVLIRLILNLHLGTTDGGESVKVHTTRFQKTLLYPRFNRTIKDQSSTIGLEREGIGPRRAITQITDSNHIFTRRRDDIISDL